MTSAEQTQVLNITRRIVGRVRPDEQDIVTPALLQPSDKSTSGFLGFGAEAALILVSPFIVQFFKDLLAGVVKPLGESLSNKLLGHVQKGETSAERAVWIETVSTQFGEHLKKAHLSSSDIKLAKAELSRILIEDPSLLVTYK